MHTVALYRTERIENPFVPVHGFLPLSRLRAETEAP